VSIRVHSRFILSAAALLSATHAPLTAQTPPATFTAEVSRTSSDKVTVDFTHHPIRHENFQVLLVQADGSMTTHTPLPPRTYLGTVQGHSGAIACGWLRPDGTLFARVAFEDGVEWVTTGGNASVRGSTTWQPAWPTTVVPAGGAGGVVYATETGVDLPNRQLVASGGTPDLAVGMAEYSVMSANHIFLRDAAIVHRIGRVVIRMAESNDPYQTPASVTTGTLLDEVKIQWNNVLPAGSNHRVALVAHPAVNGAGLAWVGVIGDSTNPYSSNGSTANGDFSGVWRHEVGHNWGANHYEGGGRPEGPTIMSDNSLPRFSSSELQKIIAHRNSRLAFLESIPAYPFPLPPRANQDRTSLTTGQSTAIDVLANDSDSNGQAISILSFDAVCSRGGTVTRLAGAGPGGRDLLSYAPHPEFQNGTGFFRYRIADSTGLTATGYVMLRPAEESFQPLHHWALDETSGTTAFNATSGPDGTHANNPSINQPGATPVTGRGVSYNGTNQSTTIPALGLTGNSYTFTAWIRRNGSQGSGAPILYSRNSNSSNDSYTGLYLSSNALRVRWNGTLFTPSPTLSVPDNQWCLAAFSVSPTQVLVHLRTASGLTTSTHNTTITAASFPNPFLLARSQPTSGSILYFGGSIDDVRIFPGALSTAQIGTLYSQAASPPDFAITSPEPGQTVNPQGTRFIAAATRSAEWLRSADFYDINSSYSFGTVAAAPFVLPAGPLDPGPRVLGASASYGDWGYQVEAAPVSFTVLETDRPVVTLTASGQPSFGGAGTRFVFRRNSSQGTLTVPFTLSGTATRNADYTIPGNSVSFAIGQNEVTIDLSPAAAPSSPGEKSVTLAISQTGDFTIESPSSAAVVFAESVRSVAGGNWSLGATWSNGQPAPTSGTQGTGPDYLIMGGHVVRSYDENSNSQTMVARTLRVSNNGRLELARTHSATLQDVTYQIPRVSLDTGAALRFVASVGSSGHHFAAPVEAVGNALIQFSGGSYDQFANLTGPITGTGNLTLQSLSSAGAVTANVRAFSILSAGNPYSGNWSIEHTPSGDDFGALRAAAVNALGSGGVTVLRRSHLINDQSGGLDSLTFITLSGQTSSLLLNQPTQAANAALTLASSSAEVVVGNAASTLGSLAGSAGTIRGSGASSLLAIHQTGDGTFSGAIGENLRLRKQGPARLALTGTVHAGTAIEMDAGRLSPGTSPRTIAALSQSGGILELPGAAASPATPRITVTGAAVFTGGTVELAFSSTPQLGVPYQIVACGSLAGTPEITVTHPGPQKLIASVQPGTGSNSVVTAVFEVRPVVYHSLTLSADPPAGGSVAGAGSYEEETITPITATPASGWSFQGWTGDGAANPAAPSTTVVMNADRVLAARFRYDTPPTVTLTASGAANALGGELGFFTISRDSNLGHTTVLLAAAGSAVPGIDYTPLPGSITIPHGETAVTLTVNTLATAAAGRQITLSLAGPEFYQIGNPGSASLEIISRIVSVASSAWNQPATWNHGQAAPTTGTQGSGEIYQIRNHTITSNDPASNSQALIGSAIRIANGGILDLARLHSFTVQNVSFNLPPVTVENGGAIRFRASVGSSSHTLATSLDSSGTTTIHNHGGAYAQDINLTGILAGDGTIQYLATSASGSTTTTRTLTLSNPATTFSGNWFVDYTATTSDDFVALRSTGSGALGTGTVTLDRRARLTAGSPNSLDSLTGITLLKPTSFADLHPHGWNQPAATLTVNAGVVDAGSSAVTVGTLAQDGGTLRLGVAADTPAPFVVAGNTTLTGGTIEVTVTGDPAGKTFEILRYQGTLAGTPVLVFPGLSRTTPTIDPGSGTNDVITATFPTGTGVSLVWQGNAATHPTHWDVATTANWTNNGAVDNFLNGDSVTFNDSAANFTPTLQGTVNAGTVTFDHTANDYTLAGPGSLATANLLKRGAGTTTISSANTFSGPVAVEGGRLRLANAAALGDSIDGAKTVTIHPAGQLDLNAFNNSAPSRSYTLDIAGNGPDQAGALVNTGGSIFSNAGVLHLVLSGNATIGGSGRFDVGWVNGNPAQGSITGNGHTLTKAGTNQIMLRGDGSATPIRIVVAQGILGAENHDACLGGTTGHVTVRDGAVLGVWGDRTLATPVTLEAGSTLRALGGGAGNWTGPITLTGAATVDLSGQAKTISGGISGPGKLTKTGGNTLTLSANNSYTGDTTIEGGTLALDHPFLADASSLHITSGATLHLTHAATDTIAELWIDGIQQAAGTYQAAGHPFLTGSGALLVTDGPPTTPYADWLAAAGLVPGAPGTGPNESADGSGVPNLLQFALGGNPNDPAKNGTHIVFDAGDGVIGSPFILTIAARGGAVFAGSPSPTATIDGVTLTMTGSANLTNWSAAVEEVVPAFDANGSLSAPPGYQLHSFRLANPPPTPAQGFLRAGVALP
jgi:autotransporter-associated beta strand protein